MRSYRTFDDLRKSMESEVQSGAYGVVIHSAAVSDYQSAGIYSPIPGTRFDPPLASWQVSGGGAPRLQDRAAAKVKSDDPELWLRLVRTPKLIDFVRREWRFPGILVKFKLEVGVDEKSLLETAERSRRESEADLMVANTLEGVNQWAMLGPLEGEYRRVSRHELAVRLLEAVEAFHKERGNG
jgi:phosphopantothenoylcysteine synthetase/decarboxylase